MPMPCEREDPYRDNSDVVQSMRYACDAGPESDPQGPDHLLSVRVYSFYFSSHTPDSPADGFGGDGRPTELLDRPSNAL